MFARLGTVLHIPLSLMLVGIVLRGSAFTFRTYDDQHDAVQRRWGRIFAGASLVTPVLLGVCIGAVASGHAGPVPAIGDFADRFVDPWLTPFSLAVGLMALALFAHLAAVFLTLESDDPALIEDFRARALWSGAALFVVAFGTLFIAPEQAPLMGVGTAGLALVVPVSHRHRSRGHRGTGGALVEALPSGAGGGGTAGVADCLGLGSLAIPLPGSARPVDPRRGRPGRHAAAGADHPRARRRGAAAVARLPVPRVQGRAEPFGARPGGRALMEDLRVSTERLELAPLTLNEIEALIAGDGARLRELTGVLFPRPAAPPPYMADPLPTVRERLRAHPDEAPVVELAHVRAGDDAGGRIGILRRAAR